MHRLHALVLAGADHAGLPGGNYVLIIMLHCVKALVIRSFIHATSVVIDSLSSHECIAVSLRGAIAIILVVRVGVDIVRALIQE